MAYRRVVSILVSLIVMAGSVMATAPVHAAGNTCVWTGAVNRFWGTSGNWTNCNGAAPTNGDSLSFDVSLVTSFGSGAVENNIANLQVSTIYFTGAASMYSYFITGNPISLSNGITETVTGPSSNAVNIGITLTASQAFTTDRLLNIAIGSTLNIGSHSLTVNGGRIQFKGPIVGTGALNFNSASTANFLDANNPGFSGPININSGRVIFNASTPSALGSGPITIAGNGILQQSFNTSGTYSIANPITMTGDGGGGNGAINLRDFTGSGVSTVNFTGPVTLTGNSTIDLDSANANFVSQPVGCGFVISQSSGSTSGNLTGNVNGSCPAPVGALAASSSNAATVAATASNSSTPGAPATGYGAPHAQKMSMTLLASAGTLMVVAGLLLLPKANLGHRER